MFSNGAHFVRTSGTETGMVPMAKRSAKVAPPKAQPATKAANANRPATAPRSGSKTETILDLLKRPDGVSLKELVKATGWQPHSLCGFLSGTIGKKVFDCDPCRKWRVPARFRRLRCRFAGTKRSPVSAQSGRIGQQSSLPTP